MQNSKKASADDCECTISFKDYLFKNKRNRTILWGVALSSVTLFSVFKYFYPFASYIHGDSFSYLDAAYQNLRINTYMIGYSKFLRLFSVFTVSDIALTAFQYLCLQAGSLFLLFTMFYFYVPGRWIKRILLIFLVFNPLYLYMGNLVSSDALFLSLSLTWFSLLLWIIHRPSIQLIAWHTIVIFLVFTIRYNALMYLFISIPAFALSQQPLRWKAWGIISSTLVIVLFIAYTGHRYKELTGTWQYSPFAGWQMANNAMYAYRYVDSADRKPVPPRFRPLDNMVRKYFDTSRNIQTHPAEMFLASTVYMWDPRSPLYIYRNTLFGKDSTTVELKKWASMGPLYKDYGWYIIRQYPGLFASYFLWPNANKYYAPPIEFLGSYNSNKDSVTPIAKVWFRYASQKVTTRTKDKKIQILDFYPILSGVINAAMLFGLLFFILLDGFRQPGPFRKGIALAGAVWILNAAFTIFASSAALRFQAFPILLTGFTVGLLVDWLWKIATRPMTQPSKPDIVIIQNETLTT